MKGTSIFKVLLSWGIVLVVVAGLACSASGQTAGSVVALKDVNSGLCIDTGGSSSFSKLFQANCSGATSQEFTLKAAPATGYYYLVNPASQLCWDVAGGSTSAGARIQQYICVASWAEYYQLSQVSAGLYKILSGNMVNGCIDVVNASTASGAKIEQNTCNGSTNQTFQVAVAGNPVSVSLSPTSASVASAGTQQFTATVTGSTNTAVTWSATAGSISTSGLFTAPTVSANTTVTVTATSQADTTKSASASVTVSTLPPPNTFGYTVQGAAIGTTMSNSILGTRYQMAGQSGTVTSMSVFIASPVSAPPNNQFQVALYADDNGTPGTLLGSTASQAIVPDAWNTVPISAPVTANTYYWLAYNTNGLAANANNLRYDAGGAPSAWISTEPFGTWPATFGPIGGTSSSSTSVYATFALSGTLAATPSSVSFGNVPTGTSNTQPVSLKNSSAAPVTITQANVTGAGFSITGLTLPVPVAASNSIILNPVFTPTSVGTVTGAVSLVSNAPNSPLTIPLGGTGVAPIFLLGANPTSLVFGNVNVGNTGSLSATLTNNGNSNVIISSVTVTGTGFSATGVSAGTILTPNQSATLNVAFAPTAAGSVTGSVSIASNATNSPTTIALSGTGTSAAGTVSVMNYGATGNGTTNDTAAINSAIAALVPGDTLLFPCGTYLTTSQLTINVSNVAIDGSGCATIHDASSGNAPIIVIGSNGNSGPSYGPAVALSATANELSTSFTTVSALGVGLGDYIYIHQGGKDSSSGSGDTACDTSGCRGEVLKVQSVSGNTITVTTALHDTYNPSVNAAVAQKMLSPVTGITVKNIRFEGTQALVYGFEMNGVVESTVSGVTARNVQGAAIYSNGSFNLSYSNITVTQAGSAACGDAVSLFVSGNMTVNGMSISNLNQGAPWTGCLYNGAFGFGLLGGVTNGTFTNVTVDATGAYGRPFKTTATRWSTFNSLTVKNGVQANNGISLEYYSSHNTFNNCVVTNNGAGTGTGTGNAGINSFGNFNQYNTFNNCTVTGNGNVQFLVSSFDALRLGQDSYVTVNGGTFTGTTSVEPVIYIEGANPTVIGTTVNGAGSQGLSMDYNAANGCINNNVFLAGSGLGSAISSNSSTNIGLGNILNGLSSNLTAGICP